MRILALKIRRQSVLSAVYHQGVLNSLRETAWNPAQGFPCLAGTVVGIIRRYQGYDGVGLCLDFLPSTRLENRYIGPYEWREGFYSLQQEIEQMLGYPTTWDDRANSFSVGEALHGVGQPYSHLLCVRYGSRITGGLVANGELYHGKDKMAGDIGHMALYPEGKACSCGRLGCYEAYASAQALVERVRLAVPSVDSGRQVLQAYKNRHPTITYIVHSWAEDVVEGLVSAIHLLSPEAVVLGGRMLQDETLFHLIRKQLQERLSQHQPDILQAQLGDRAALKGISWLAINDLQKRKALT